jgi:hypothetical protein
LNGVGITPPFFLLRRRSHLLDIRFCCLTSATVFTVIKMGSISSRRFADHRSLLVDFALFLSLACLVDSAAVPSPVKLDSKTGRPEEGTCDVKGNPDLYGLGVRLGTFNVLLGEHRRTLIPVCSMLYRC